MRILRVLEERILPILFLLLLMLAFDTAWVTVLTLLVAAIHELGHIGAAILLGVGDMSMPTAVLTGLRIRPSRLLSYREEVIIAMGGPLANILLFLLLLPVIKSSEYVFTLALINLFTAISNLIPIRGWDGHRILIGLLATRLSPEALDTVAHVLTLTLSATATLISLLFMMQIGEGYWIFSVFFVILCREILDNRKFTKREN